MTMINFDLIVSGSKEETWNVLANFAGISEVHPFVQKSYIINGTSDTGLGAERRCELSADGKKFVEERIVRYVEGKEFDVEMHGGSQMPPVKNLIGTVGMESLSSNKQRIYLKVSYQPKFGLIGMLIDMIALKPITKKAFSGVLQGFKNNIETGQPTQSLGTLRAKGLIT